MGTFVNKLSGMQTSHQYMDIKQHGVRHVVWYQKGFLESDVYRAKVDVCKQVCSATGERLPDIDLMMGWATIRTANSTKKTYAMAILVKPEHHSVIQKLDT